MGKYLYNPKTKEYIDSRVTGGCFGRNNYVFLEDGRKLFPSGTNENDDYYVYEGGYETDWLMYQKYENGLPIGKPYFEEM